MSSFLINTLQRPAFESSQVRRTAYPHGASRTLPGRRHHLLRADRDKGPVTADQDEVVPRVERGRARVSRPVGGAYAGSKGAARPDGEY
jgi:hypothetical protein